MSKIYENMKTQAESLKTRIEAALEDDQPETFAFTIGVQIGALRARVRREINSYVDRSAQERDLLQKLDDRCFYVESEMIEAMGLTREHSLMLDHLRNARQGAKLMVISLETYLSPSIGTFWTVGEDQNRDMVHITRVVDGKLVGYREIDKRGSIEWDQDGKCLTWNDSRWNLGERIR
jgi:hypothetical protein